MKHYNTLKDILAIALNIYLLFAGLGWISIHLYFRLILKRTSYTLDELFGILTYKHVIVFFSYTVLHLGLLISAIWFIVNQNNKNPPRAFFVKTALFLHKITDFIYWKPLKTLLEFIAPHIPGSGKFLVYFEHKFGNYPIFFANSLIFLFNILPKGLMAFVFAIEIVYLNKLNVFIHLLPMYLIPLIFAIFYNLQISFAERNKPILINYFYEIKGMGSPLYNQYNILIGYEQYNFTVKPEYKGVIEPKEEIELLFTLERILWSGWYFKTKINILNPYITLVTSTIYLVGGTYRLWFLFF